MKQLTSSSQTVTDTYDTDAWGANGSSAGSTVNPFRFGGQFAYFTDSDSGLLRLGVRYLDPANGRFTQRDPLGDADNSYVYASSRPLSMVDPTGAVQGFIDCSPDQVAQLKVAIDQALSKAYCIGAGHREGYVNCFRYAWVRCVPGCQHCGYSYWTNLIEICFPQPAECTQGLGCVMLHECAHISCGGYAKCDEGVAEDCEHKCCAHPTRDPKYPPTPGFVRCDSGEPSKPIYGAIWPWPIATGPGSTGRPAY